MRINRDYITQVNFTDCNNLGRIKYIVIHYFGSLSTAKNLGKYWENTFAAASAHYGIDHNGDKYQYVEDEDIAWHCGGVSNYKHPECRNSNSIGIELAVRKRNTKTLNATDKDWYFEDATVNSAIELVKMLMKKYNIPADHVLRHYDVTGKICPNPFVYNTGSITWEKFKAAISESEIQNQRDDEDYSLGTEQLIWGNLDLLKLSDFAKAAILGNLDAESGLRSNNMQDAYEKLFNDETYTKAVDDGTYSKEKFIHDGIGYGLAQWTYWTRKQALYETVVEKLGLSIGDRYGQIAFMIDELKRSFPTMLSELKECTTIAEATNLVMRKYEAPSNQSTKEQKRRAEFAFKHYGKLAAINQPISNNVFLVKVEIPDLRIRTGPGTNYVSRKTSKEDLYTGIGVFTIVNVKAGAGSDSGWGLLKYYSENKDGWISLDFAKQLL